MAHAMVLVFVKTLRRWKLLSMANTHAASVERLAVYYHVMTLISYRSCQYSGYSGVPGGPVFFIHLLM